MQSLYNNFQVILIFGKKIGILSLKVIDVFYGLVEIGIY